MTTSQASWAYSLGAIFVMSAAFAIQRYVTRRYVRSHLREEALRETVYARRGPHPFVVLLEELEAEWDRLAPLYDPDDAGVSQVREAGYRAWDQRTDRWAK